MAITVTNAGFNGGLGPNVSISLLTSVAAGDVLFATAALTGPNNRVINSLTTADSKVFSNLLGGPKAYGPTDTNTLQQLALVYDGAGLTAGQTIAAVYNASTTASAIEIVKISGLSAAPLDLGASPAAFAQADSSGVISLTTAPLLVDDEIVLVGAAWNNSGALTASGWTQYSNLFNSNAQRITIAHKILTGGAGGTTGFSGTMTSGDWGAAYASFMPFGAVIPRNASARKMKGVG